MSRLYLDLGMGAAGDMLAAALYELLPLENDFLKRMNSAGIPDVVIEAQKVSKCGLCGTHMNVICNCNKEHHHRSPEEIKQIISSLKVSENVKINVAAVYDIIADAESKVHGVPVSEIHFHEVGTSDAIADITMVCSLIEELNIKEIHATPVHTGSGTVKCAHGILPVPAPATAEILCDIPWYSSDIKGELCTPTGAALLKYFVTSFASSPAVEACKIGYGMGSRDFDRPNCIRAFYCKKSYKDIVSVLCCNIDDMSAEDVSFAVEKIRKSAALDVFVQPVIMKKNRLGTKINVICNMQDKDFVLKIIFKYTSTLGIREYAVQRAKLERVCSKKDTFYGVVNEKESFGFGIVRKKSEYEDLARIAENNDMSVHEVRKELK